MNNKIKKNYKKKNLSTRLNKIEKKLNSRINQRILWQIKLILELLNLDLRTLVLIVRKIDEVDSNQQIYGVKK